MNKIVNIFYNGFDYDCPLPQDDKWSNYTNSTSPRMFLQCAVSWQRNGWEVKRISSELSYAEGFKFTGRLQDSLTRYGYPYWNLWKLIEKLDSYEPIFVVNMDTYNQDYTPEQFDLDTQGIGNSTGISLHVNRWSNAAMRVNCNFARQVCACIEDYDIGFKAGIEQVKMPIIEAHWVSDEMIIRELMQHSYITKPRCDFGFIKPHWDKAPMIQISRSVISRAMATIPVVR